jgi:two-component system chemotaxis sensor kinase CheA
MTMSHKSGFEDGFRQEAEERLTEIEESILDLEENPADSQAVDRLFRAIHSIKGSGAMFGFDEIASFAHYVEHVLEKVRKGELSATRDVIELILTSHDHIKAMLYASEADSPEDKTQRDRTLKALQALLPGEPHADAAPSVKIADTECQQPDGKGQQITYQIRFRPSHDVFRSGMDPALLVDELGELGECSIRAQREGIPPLAELDAELCYLSWDIVLTTTSGINAIRDVFIFVEDESQIRIEPIADELSIQAHDSPPRLGEILVDRGDTTPQRVKEVLGDRRRIGELLVDSGEVSPDKVKSALDVQKALSERATAAQSASVRVGADKLDTLINLVGELVINQDRLTQVAANTSSMELAGPVEDIGRLVQDIRDCTLNLRMLPIGGTFMKFKRLVRDLSVELGKDIELVTEGAETELDKTVIERLGDPLVHLIRNSVDHGIESPEDRKKAGKPPKGTIRLTATHREANVVITIEDDGRGLDREAIKSRAIERGLMEPGADLRDSEILDLIFTPGFSTAANVSSVSGRGVGMDVVKRSIQSLRGSIRLDGEKGKGATVSLFMPLTLAIIESFIVDVNGSCFVLPMTQVEECVELAEDHVSKAHGRHLIPIRGEPVPYVRLRELFGISGNELPLEQIVVLNSEDNRIGIVVDEIVGVRQVVIKSLGRFYQDVEGVSGATIMGDGTVGLIVDVPGLIRTATREQQSLWDAEDFRTGQLRESNAPGPQHPSVP